MRRLSAMTLLAMALVSAIPTFAQTLTTMTGSYTGRTAGPGIYWTDGGQYTGDGSPGVMFSLSESLVGTLVDITVEDDLETNGIAELGGHYYFYGEPEPLLPLPLGVYGPVPVLSSGEFCGTADSLLVPAGASALHIAGNLTSCQVPHPGTSGEVTVTFRLP